MGTHTPGPWILADSCSWRRIVTDDMTPVIVPTNNPYDGHPDLCGERADLELAARAPELLEEIERLRREIQNAQSALVHDHSWRKAVVILARALESQE